MVAGTLTGVIHVVLYGQFGPKTVNFDLGAIGDLDFADGIFGIKLIHGGKNFLKLDTADFQLGSGFLGFCAEEGHHFVVFFADCPIGGVHFDRQFVVFDHEMVGLLGGFRPDFFFGLQHDFAEMPALFQQKGHLVFFVLVFELWGLGRGKGDQ